MKSTKRSRAALSLAALAAVGALLLSGCTSDEPEAEPTNTAEAEAPAVNGNEPDVEEEAPSSEEDVATEEAPPPEALAVEDETIQEIAQKYINERENQASHYREEPTEWLDDVKEYMTAEGHQSLAETAGEGASGGYAWAQSHDQGLAVEVRVGECEELTQAGEGSDTEKTISCPVTDIVVDEDGDNLPTNEIPPTWPYVGDQQDALLAMKKSGEGWKVDMDMTGMAN